ncbi:hypothetical protein [Thiolapillus sp.]|uniref:hypothetical protein n=1 Tax=Thiolapillus sp. TaxID=2017437 RepID=UPI0027397ADB|nr:hypothetical protein [Thiolapillus sp.]
MTRTAGAPIGCQRPSRFWGLGCPKIYHEVEDTLDTTKNPSHSSGQPRLRISWLKLFVLIAG